MNKQNTKLKDRITKTVVFDEEDQIKEQTKPHKQLPTSARVVISLLLIFVCCCIIVLLVYVITYLYGFEANV